MIFTYLHTWSRIHSTGNQPSNKQPTILQTIQSVLLQTEMFLHEHTIFAKSEVFFGSKVKGISPTQQSWWLWWYFILFMVTIIFGAELKLYYSIFDNAWLWSHLANIQSSSKMNRILATNIPSPMKYPIPIPSMYGIFTYIWLMFMVNVGKYTIHGLFGIYFMSTFPLTKICKLYMSWYLAIQPKAQYQCPDHSATSNVRRWSFRRPGESPRWRPGSEAKAI